MICVCGKPEDANKALEAADKLREDAKKLLTWDESTPCTDRTLLSRAVGNLYWDFGAEVEVAVDQWFGAYATVKKYVDCEHDDGTPITAGTTAEQIEQKYAACPGEPECFVYRWDDVLRVTVECDRLEDGIAALVKYFYETRSSQDGETA
jgi:hypothetical protein